MTQLTLLARPISIDEGSGELKARAAAASMGTTVIFLGEVAERTDRLDVLCRKCDRHGILSVARLVQEHGPAMPIPQLRTVPAADCERLRAAA